ncbi:TonB-dependent receptor family protein [Flavisericum labens]|uniref:TonB-dependent receptor family protein n=1 Tax=Flavisericum labens TaxID=3377112 RepID=UPI00387B5366
MHFTKLHLSFFIYIGCSSLSLGQIKLTGKTIDSQTKEPLANVIVINVKTNDTINSNQHGYFEVAAEGVFLFKKEGYLESTLTLKYRKDLIIHLQKNPSQLNEVVITTSTTSSILKRTPATVNIVSNKDIERANHINFTQSLNRVPGVFMQSGALNTNRVTIRGIGSRNLFGTSKIRAYFKDIPLTNGSGETNIEDFELASIGKIEIIKGSISTIYGAGLGGTITLVPKQSVVNQSAISSELTTGSFGLLKSVTTLNYGQDKNNLYLTRSTTQSNGFRENNQYNRQTVTLNSNHNINLKNEISVLASYIDLKAFIPSSINETTYLNAPEMADTNWKNAKGFEDSKRGVFGVSWNHNLNENTDLISSVFLSFRNAYEPRPFNILKEETLAYGLRSRFVGRTKLFNKKVNYSLGGELFRDSYNYETFENLYKNFPEGTGSVAGNQLSNFKEKRYNYNAFAEVNFQLSEKTTLSTGINLNKTGYRLSDNFPVSDTNADQSGRFEFKNIVSPKFGVSYIISKNANIFGNINHGFSPISLNETLLPDGQINPDIKPETGWNFEIGSRGSALNERFRYSLSVFRLNIKNLLVSRRTSQDQFIGVNAGKTQHDGLETSAEYLIKGSKRISINIFSNLTWNHFTFKDFIDGNNDFSGNDLTGVPSHVFNLGIDVNSKIGLYGNVNFQQVGKMPITDGNLLYSDMYSLTNLKLGYSTNLNKNLKLNAFFGLNNIFDTVYASQILINASSFGGNAPRYFYPGNPLNFYAGFNVNYLF